MLTRPCHWCPPTPRCRNFPILCVAQLLAGLPSAVRIAVAKHLSIMYSEDSEVIAALATMTQPTAAVVAVRSPRWLMPAPAGTASAVSAAVAPPSSSESAAKKEDTAKKRTTLKSVAGGPDGVCGSASAVPSSSECSDAPDSDSDSDCSADDDSEQVALAPRAAKPKARASAPTRTVDDSEPRRVNPVDVDRSVRTLLGCMATLVAVDRLQVAVSLAGIRVDAQQRLVMEVRATVQGLC